MYQKAIIFEDTEIAKKILKTKYVSEIKALGRHVSNYNDKYWNGVSQIIVYKGLLAKFSQNDDLKKRLLNKDNDILAECAVQDKIRGIGLSMKDTNRWDMAKWRGEICILQNIGEILSAVLMTA